MVGDLDASDLQKEAAAGGNELLVGISLSSNKGNQETMQSGIRVATIDNYQVRDWC